MQEVTTKFICLIGLCYKINLDAIIIFYTAWIFLFIVCKLEFVMLDLVFTNIIGKFFPHLEYFIDKCEFILQYALID